MADINADVIHVEGLEANAATILKPGMVMWATDTSRWIYKTAGSVIKYFFDADALADQTGIYGASIIGCAGIPGMAPYDGSSLGSVSGSGTVQEIIAGIGQCVSRMIHVDATAADWTSSPGGEETLHTYTLPGGTISTAYFLQSLKIRLSFSLDDASTKIMTVYANAVPIATITTTESGACVFDIEIINRDVADQFITSIIQAGADQNPSIIETAYDFDSDIVFTVAAEVTSGITGDCSYRSMTIEYRGTNGL